MSSYLWARVTGWARSLRTQGDLRGRGHSKDSSGPGQSERSPGVAQAERHRCRPKLRGQWKWKPRALASWHRRGISTGGRQRHGGSRCQQGNPLCVLIMARSHKTLFHPHSRLHLREEEGRHGGKVQASYPKETGIHLKKPLNVLIRIKTQNGQNSGTQLDREDRAQRNKVECTNTLSTLPNMR